MCQISCQSDKLCRKSDGWWIRLTPPPPPPSSVCVNAFLFKASRPVKPNDRNTDCCWNVCAIHLIRPNKCPDNLHKHRAWLTLESPRDARCFIISGIDQIFELNKLCLLKKVIEGQAP